VRLREGWRGLGPPVKGTENAACFTHTREQKIIKNKKEAGCMAKKCLDGLSLGSPPRPRR
jgi:hypothetical protein